MPVMTSPGGEEHPRWHQALAFAVTGRRFAELGSQPAPDPGRLGAWLTRHAPGDLDGVATPVPDDLMRGIGPAQFWAALARLRTELRPAGPSVAPVTANRPLTADERRLLADVPPHHGS